MYGVYSLSTSYSYDSGGRETQTYAYVCNQNAGYQGPSGGSSLLSTNLYDAEDHLVSGTQSETDYEANCTTENSVWNSTSFVWGPNGHPATIAGQSGSGAIVGQSGGPVQHIQLHWDGETLLFTSDDNGVHEVKIRGFGSVTEEHGYFYTYDRSQEGGLAYVHSTISTYLIPPQCGGQGDCEDVGEPTDESIQYYGQTIQGARGVDTTTTTWQTPDAASGSIHDPMSQMPYVFENNNSIEYKDPTGYFTDDPGAACTWANSCEFIPNENYQPEVASAADYKALQLQMAVRAAISKVTSAGGGANPAAQIKAIQAELAKYGVNAQSSREGLVWSKGGIALRIYPSSKTALDGSVERSIQASISGRGIDANAFSNRFGSDKNGTYMAPRWQGAPRTYFTRPMPYEFFSKEEAEEE